MELHLTADLESRVQHLGQQQGRDPQSLVEEAVERLIDGEDWFSRQVEQGLQQIEAGMTLSHEEVGARLDRYLARLATHV